MTLGHNLVASGSHFGSSKIMQLEKEIFRSIVKYTPLMSIDLVVCNSQGHVLLGERKIRPSHGYWFVPGGRIFKDESFINAFARLTREELGVGIPLSAAQFLGAYEHHYTDNVFGDGFSTHYVVLGYRIQLDADVHSLPQAQHAGYHWFSEEELLQHPQVHENTKAYFLDATC